MLEIDNEMWKINTKKFIYSEQWNINTLNCSIFSSIARSLFRTYLIDTSIIAKMRYFPSKGTTNDVGGIISTTSRKNTWRLIRIDIDSVTCQSNSNGNAC